MTDLPAPGARQALAEGFSSPRNTIAHTGDDLDHGPGTKGHKQPVITPEQASLFAAVDFRHKLQMLSDQAFNYSHPVDEYAPQGMPSPASGAGLLTITVQPDYDMPERIETILVIIPVGATSALLQLGQRTMQLYSGVALTVPSVINMHVSGVILNSDDPRVLTLTGATTSAGFVQLCGWALTRGQFS